MAPSRDETVDGLKDMVHQLQSRVEYLEGKLQHSAGLDPTRRPAQPMRMILMGPPGAGTIWSLGTLDCPWSSC